MRINTIHIENYRSIENITLDLHKHNILVGKNNSGKSNVLRAIDLVLGEGYVKVCKTDFFNQDESRTIKIELVLGDFSEEEIGKIIPEIKYPGQEGGERKSSSYIATVLRRDRKIKMVVEITQAKTEKNLYFSDIYYKYFSGELREAILTSVFIPSMRDPSNILKINNYSFLNKVLRKIYEISDAERKRELCNILEDATRKCKELFRDSEERLDGMSRRIIDHEGLTLSMLPGDTKDIYKKITLLLDDGIETELDFKGSGMQSVIIISLFKLYADMRAGSAILLLEEPEAFLHPHANRHMSKILKELCAADNIQLILTTHSPNYLQDFDLKSLILLRKEQGKSVKKVIESVSNETKLKREMNARTLEMFFAEKVVLVEGETDSILLPVISRQVSPDFDFDKRNVSILCATSKANFDVFVEILNQLDIPWSIIADKDMTSLAESKRILERMNRKFSWGLDIVCGEAQLNAALKQKQVHVLQTGDIESYYRREWCYSLIETCLEDADMNSAQVSASIALIRSLTDRSQMGMVKAEANRLGLEDEALEVLQKIISVKGELLTLDFEQQKMGGVLESVFRSLKLSKPLMALRISPYFKLNDLAREKREELSEIIRQIFDIPERIRMGPLVVP